MKIRSGLKILRNPKSSTAFAFEAIFACKREGERDSELERQWEREK